MKTQDKSISRLGVTLQVCLDLAETYDAKATDASDNTWMEGYYEGKSQAFRMLAQWLESDFEDE